VDEEGNVFGYERCRCDKGKQGCEKQRRKDMTREKTVFQSRNVEMKCTGGGGEDDSADP
jgi:hypothetical protein